MKDTTVQTGKKILNVAKGYSLRLIFLKIVYFFSGILISRGVVFGRYYPFGLSLSASAPGRLVAPVALGSMLGYLFPLRFGMGIRYISAIIAIAAIRWTLSDIKKIKNHFLYVPLMVFISSFVTSLAINCASGIEANNVAIGVLESLIASGAAYFFDRTFKIFSAKRFYGLTVSEFVCVAVSVSIVFFSLGNVLICGVSLGRVCAVVSILIVAYSFGVTGGAICGISSGIIFSMPSFGFTYFGCAYAFGGMIAGLCSKYGKIAVCVFFMFSSIVASFQSGDISKTIGILYESVFAMIIFLILPANFLNSIRLSSGDSLNGCSNLSTKQLFSKKLNFTSKVLACIPKMIDNIFAGFANVDKSDFKCECFKKINNVCAKCSMKTTCYERYGRNESVKKLLSSVLSNKDITDQTIVDAGFQNCIKIPTLTNVINESKDNFALKKSQSLYLDDMRKAMNENFRGASLVIEDVSDKILSVNIADYNIKNCIQNVLNKNQISFSDIICTTDEYARVFIEIELPIKFLGAITSNVLEQFEILLNRKLDKPFVVEMDKTAKIFITEEKNFAVDIGVAQHSCNNGNFCGDSCKYFEDGYGNFNVIISDGMGTGQKAAVEGAVASELMKSCVKFGINFNSAIKFVNSALLVTSNEENLATIDAVSLNLFTGEAKFMKAGSPITFIMQGSQITKLDFTSLPIGIFSDVKFVCKNLMCKPNDWIIMLSDGATDIGEQWIKNILSGKKYQSASDLAKSIIKHAVNLRKSDHDDDITAVVINIKNKNL